MSYEAKIDVFLKEGVSDPEGLTIAEAAKSLEIAPVHRVRSGKSFLVLFDLASESETLAAANKIGLELLSNPVIQDFVISEITEISGE